LGAQAASPKAFGAEVAETVVGTAVLAGPHPAAAKTNIIANTKPKIFVTFI
jgi:hypothetical protein